VEQPGVRGHLAAGAGVAAEFTDDHRQFCFGGGRWNRPAAGPLVGMIADSSEFELNRSRREMGPCFPPQAGQGSRRPHVETSPLGPPYAR
jgi:hypothetical protein